MEESQQRVTTPGKTAKCWLQVLLAERCRVLRVRVS